MQNKFGFPHRKPLSQMTTVEAQSIVAYLAELEFPKIFYTSLQFALFKVRAYWDQEQVLKLILKNADLWYPHNF